MSDHDRERLTRRIEDLEEKQILATHGYRNMAKRIEALEVVAAGVDIHKTTMINLRKRIEQLEQRPVPKMNEYGEVLIADITAPKRTVEERTDAPINVKIAEPPFLHSVIRNYCDAMNRACGCPTKLVVQISGIDHALCYEHAAETIENVWKELKKRAK